MCNTVLCFAMAALLVTTNQTSAMHAEQHNKRIAHVTSIATKHEAKSTGSGLKSGVKYQDMSLTSGNK